VNTKEIDDYFMQDKSPEPPQEQKPPVQEPPIRHPQPRHEPVMSRGIPELILDCGLPANVDAEKTVLGAIMLDSDALKTISTTINADDFFLDSHRRIIAVMESLWKEGKAIDIVTISNELSKRKELETVGGVSFLAGLTEGIPLRPVIDEYIRIIADKSIGRRLMLISSAIIQRAADQSENAIQTLDVLEAQLVQLKDRSRVLSRRRNPLPFFVGFRTFVGSYPDKTEWAVEGLIQKEGNGLILGDPGSSKSLAVFDLALHLVGGVAWFHHRIPRRIKVGIVTREDAPGLSQSRLKRLKEGASESLNMFLEGIDLEDWLYVNTRAQRETWTLQKETDIQEIIEAIKERQIEMCFFDVFRVLWHGNENDSQETAAVLEAAKRIGREAKCQVGLVHHISKSDRGTIFDRARGSGILGWREWAIGITIENPDVEPKDQIRRMEFQTKASGACSPIFYRIDGYEKKLCLEEVEAPIQQFSYREKKGKKKEPESPKTSMPYKENEDTSF
jgi:hypothetical protein